MTSITDPDVTWVCCWNESHGSCCFWYFLRFAPFDGIKCTNLQGSVWSEFKHSPSSWIQAGHKQGTDLTFNVSGSFVLHTLYSC